MCDVNVSLLPVQLSFSSNILCNDVWLMDAYTHAHYMLISCLAEFSIVGCLFWLCECSVVIMQHVASCR